MYIKSPLIRGYYIFDESKVSQKTLTQVFYDKQNPLSGEIYAFFAYPRRAFVSRQVDKKLETIGALGMRNVSIGILKDGFTEDGEARYPRESTSSYALNALLNTEYGTKLWKMIQAWPIRSAEDVRRYYRGEIRTGELATKILPILNQYLQLTIVTDEEYAKYSNVASAEMLGIYHRAINTLAESTVKEMQEIERGCRDTADFRIKSSANTIESMADFSLQQAICTIPSLLLDA